ncbi:MAG: thermopsin family protease [Thermoproteus sp.]|nr:thermopsin family protease [Thermoproteus sp.]
MRLGSILVVVLAALLLAAAAHGYGLQPTGQCVSRALNLAHQKLWPDDHFPLWFFVGTGVQLIIRFDVSSNVPVELAIFYTSSNMPVELARRLGYQVREIWATQPSTRIVGNYTVDLKAPGAYELFIKNPSSATAIYTAILNVIMCGGPAVKSWLEPYIAPWRRILNKTPVFVAPMGIAAYGVMEVDGQYFTYTLTTDAVKGVAYIPSNISASDYYWNGAYYYGQAYSVRLSAFVVARLTDGTAQYYWIQNIVGFEKGGGLKVWDNIWNVTTVPSILDNSTVRGNGEVHFGQYGYTMPNSIPFGRVELEMRAYAADGKIIVEFYANGQEYDEVTITPRVPAVSAYIVIAPTRTPADAPLDLELVFGGYPRYIPLAVLNAGRIGLELYVRMNGAWVPPPSAWSIGSMLVANLVFGYSSASVVPQGVGSALVVPGAPNPRQLWAGTIIATPIGINATNSTDLSPYAGSLPKLVNFGNGTRLILVAYVNGRPAQLSSLSAVPLGSLVVLQYERQYLVSISAPGNYTTGWFDEGSTIVVDEPPVVDLGNDTRLVNPLINGTALPLSISIDKPISLSVEYTRQYLASIHTPFYNSSVWVNAGASYASAEVPTTFAGLPALYAEASIACGGATNSTPGFFASSLELELTTAPAGKCSISVHEVPSLALVIVAVVAAIVILFRKLRKRS